MDGSIPRVPVQSDEAEAFRRRELTGLLTRARARTAPPPWSTPAPGAANPRGVTQAQVAEQLGIDERHYRNLEHGDIAHPAPAWTAPNAATSTA
jgi:hypothetical protein